jgi:aminopeptidase N
MKLKFSHIISRASWCKWNFALGLCLLFSTLFSQSGPYSHADSLKGAYSKERSWWDVNNYDLHVSFDIPDSSIMGYNQIAYTVLQTSAVLQLDLMKPMVLDSVVQEGKKCSWRQDGNAYFVNLVAPQVPGDKKVLTAYFHGKPRAAKMPPWDGGMVWSQDAGKNPWVSVACQGMAAQVWFPNKDHMADEVESASMHFTVPRNLVAVSNGKLLSIQLVGEKSLTYSWHVSNPINNYNIIPYIGRYVNVKDTFLGKGGTLDLEYWVLDENYSKVKKHFSEVKPMLRCFEDWFGKYPFYEDGYKLVEAPYLGMEHQSAIAYGNNFLMGYKGRDLSNTGWGLKWDFIIVHESGHEWFGNSISAKDVADNWIHESFTAYAENLYNECRFGKKAGAEYVIGTRAAITNDKPIISDYNVNSGGSIDLYYKGANMLHTLRQIVGNDSLWKEALRGLNTTFYHQTVTTAQVEDFLISFLHLDQQKMFDQYLRTVNVPVLEYKLRKRKLSYRWGAGCVRGFNMPVRIVSNGGQWLRPAEKWESVPYSDSTLVVDENFYIRTKLIK